MAYLSLQQKVERDIKKRLQRSQRGRPKNVRFVYLGIKELREAYDQDMLDTNHGYRIPSFSAVLRIFRGAVNCPPEINYMGLCVHFYDVESYFNTK